MNIKAKHSNNNDNKNNVLDQEIKTTGINIEEFYEKEEIKKKSNYKKTDFYNRFLTVNGSFMISKPFNSDELKKYNMSLYDILKSLNSDEVFGLGLSKGWENDQIYTNNISFDKFAIGDILVATSPGFHIQGAIRHAAIFDSRKYHGSIDDKCLLTAEPDQGVIYESLRFYRENFSEAWGLSIPEATLKMRIKAVNEITKFEGKTYSWRAKKEDDNNWYCSKVPWGAYYKVMGIDLDYNDGFWVLPVDIFLSDHTKIFEYNKGQ